MGDVVLFRRLFSQARPYWPHVVALFLLSLLSSPLSLLTPLPLKIAVDSVIGSHPLPHAIASLVPEAITHSPAGHRRGPPGDGRTAAPASGTDQHAAAGLRQGEAGPELPGATLPPRPAPLPGLPRR